ncbi:MAG: 50S ribosomal protein L5 [Chloroflexota bacterium]|nr:MAG: 50S ribosomal protein L5 [Chloroflexota bacterium]
MAWLYAILPLNSEVNVLTPLKEQYQNDVVPALMNEFGYKSVMQAPRITKVVVNVGLGEALDNAKAIEFATNDITLITGQKPIVTKAKNSIAGFKLREGRAIGVKVTLRGDRMWMFLTRLIHLALPRVRDFQGVSPDAFDGRGNYTLGLREQLIFPEINYDKIDKLRGMEVSIVTTAKTDEEGRQLLALLGMPFQRDM